MNNTILVMILYRTGDQCRLHVERCGTIKTWTLWPHLLNNYAIPDTVQFYVFKKNNCEKGTTIDQSFQ